MTPKRVSNEEARARCSEKSLTPLQEFPGRVSATWQVRCTKCGSVFKTSLTAITSAKMFGCASCSRSYEAKKKGFRLTSASLKKAGWKLETSFEMYKDSRSKVVVRHLSCGNETTGFPHLLLSKKCQCEIDSELEQRLSKGIEVASRKGGKLLDDRYVNSKHKARWQCKKGHTWRAQWGSVVAADGSWCPYCSGRLPTKGINDLGTVNRPLAEQFDSEKNKPQEAHDFLPNSHKKVWWLCNLGHSYQAILSNRHLLGNGCPYCSNHRVLEGFNDLQHLEPYVASLWHPKKNSTKPSQVTRTANKKAFWLCANGHETHSLISTKVATRGGCPTCSGKVLARGFNDLKTKRPDLADCWHPDLNGSLSPEDVTAFSNKKVWWLCSKGHHWRKDVGGRAQGRGCPYCAFKKCWPGFNDLATTHPDMLEEWDFGKNEVSPSSIIAGGKHTVIWNCQEHGNYQASTLARCFGAKSGCPSCAESGFRVIHSGLVYLLENTDLGARKIGITNTHKTRRRVDAFINRGWRLINSWEDSDGKIIQQLERALLKTWLQGQLGMNAFLSNDEMSSLNGYTETFSMDGPSNLEIIEKGTELYDELKKSRDKDPELFRLG